MASLFIRGDEIESIFQLFGYDEDSISLVLAWSLTKSKAYLIEFLRSVIKWDGALPRTEILFQQNEPDYGITDIELVGEDSFHLIIEAKKGWKLPKKRQLTKYARRKSFSRSPSVNRRIVTLSECSSEYAKLNLPFNSIKGVPVIHVSWQDMLKYAKIAINKSSGRERTLLKELSSYFGKIMKIQKKDSSLVYVVSLSTDKPQGWRISWDEVVTKKKVYFHPIRAGWPKEPPTYIGFRFHGHLQSIHYIEDYKIINDLHDACKEIPSEQYDALFLYKLGPAIKPPKPVKTGKLYRNARTLCAIDLLLTCGTISEARDLTKLRFAED